MKTTSFLVTINEMFRVPHCCQPFSVVFKFVIHSLLRSSYSFKNQQQKITSFLWFIWKLIFILRRHFLITTFNGFRRSKSWQCHLDDLFICHTVLDIDILSSSLCSPLTKLFGWQNDSKIMTNWSSLAGGDGPATVVWFGDHFTKIVGKTKSGYWWIPKALDRIS